METIEEAPTEEIGANTTLPTEETGANSAPPDEETGANTEEDKDNNDLDNTLNVSTTSSEMYLEHVCPCRKTGAFPTYGSASIQQVRSSQIFSEHL